MAIVRTSSTLISAGVTTDSVMSGAGELWTLPWDMKMALEGRVFLAGTGLEEAGVDGEAAIDDTTPSWALSAPDSGTIVVPLWFRIYFDTEGGAAPDWHFTYVQATKATIAAGTAMTAINALGGSSPRSASGKLQNTLSSVTAITSAENVVLDERIQILDNFVSVEAATTVNGVESPGGLSTMQAIVRMGPGSGLPLALYGGSFVAFYTATGTTDSKYNVAACWAELDATHYGKS